MIQHDRTICDATAIRYFALVGQFDLLTDTVGVPVLVPGAVLDLEEDLDAPSRVVSEIGGAVRYFARRSADEDARESWTQLRNLWQREDIAVVDLDTSEEDAFAEIIDGPYQLSDGSAVQLGRGESAVISIVEQRNYSAALDDQSARRVLVERCPESRMFTTRELLRRAVGELQLLTSPEAEIVYEDMRAHRYRGPPTLWE